MDSDEYNSDVDSAEMEQMSQPNDEFNEDEWEEITESTFADETHGFKGHAPASERDEPTAADEEDEEDDMWQSVWQQGGITITIDRQEDSSPAPAKKRKKIHTQTPEERARDAYIRRMKHRTHLICMVSYLSILNEIADDQDLQALWLSCYPSRPSSYSAPMSLGVFLNRLVDWVNPRFSFYEHGQWPAHEVRGEKIQRLVKGPKLRRDEYILTLTSLIRVLGYEARIVYNIRPVPFKKSTPPSVYCEIDRSVRTFSLPSDSSDKMDANAKYFLSKQRRNDAKRMQAMKKSHSLIIKETDCWIEIYSPDENKWIHYNPFAKSFDKPEGVETSKKTLTYVIGIEGGGYIRDVTIRYASKWTHSRRYRDNDWWEDLIYTHNIGKPVNQITLDQENLEFRLYAKTESLPTSIGAYKSHPLYALEQHLSKHQVIYPRDTVLGFCGKFPVFPRDSVQMLYSKEKWRRKGRIVKDNELPIKKFTANHVTAFINPTGELELFGLWQTEPYIPPTVVDGKVPKNRFGNVEAYPEMPLPIGSVHLRIPGIASVAKKLGINYAPALTGWELRRDRKYPVIEGIVVASEFEDILKSACEETMTVVKEKLELQRKQNIQNAWVRLARKLLVRQKVQKLFAETTAGSSLE